MVLGVGVHMNSNARSVIDVCLGPALQVRGDFYRNTNVSEDSQWPRIFFVLPLLTGPLKPPEHLISQNDAATAKFAEGMRVYCRQHHIPVIDFRNLTKLVHSFDGTHYGLGVNLMKNQVLLNYIAQQTGRETT